MDFIQRPLRRCKVGSCGHDAGDESENLTWTPQVFEEIHTDMVLMTNREYGLDPTAWRIHTEMAPMTNKEPD